MKDIALAAGFLAVMLLGFYLMVKLAKTIEEMQEQKESYCFHIATSNPCAIKQIMEFLSDMKVLHPDMHYTLSIGQEGEILQMLNSRRLDAAVVSPEAAGGRLLLYRLSVISPQPLVMDEDGALLASAEKESQQQKVMWRMDAPNPLAQEFVHQFCIRKA